MTEQPPPELDSQIAQEHEVLVSEWQDAKRQLDDMIKGGDAALISRAREIVGDRKAELDEFRRRHHWPQQ